MFESLWDVFWVMLWFFLFFIWVWLLISILGDVIRRDMSGFGKALWVLVLIVVPIMGALMYLIVNGGDMQARQIKQVQDFEDAQKDYIRSVTGTASPADELVKLAQLRDAGVLTAEEFSEQKARLLA